MEDVLVIGAGPAGLLTAWMARQGGARVRVLAAGVGTTHVMPGWLSVLSGTLPVDTAVEAWAVQHPNHPYALAGTSHILDGVAALREVCEPAGVRYAGTLSRNYLLPTALGALIDAAYAPVSFIAGDVLQPGAMLIAGPAGWRDFYPALCAGNLSRQGVGAEAATFALPEMLDSMFDATAAGLARILDVGDVRARIAAELRPKLNGAARVGLPAILGLDHHAEAWRDLQDRLGVPVFEIPTLPPSVPGMRLWQAFKAAFMKAGIQLLLDMPVARGLIEQGRAAGVTVAGAARETVFRAGKVILATGGLYGGGILTDHHGSLCEPVYGLPVEGPTGPGSWFGEKLLPADHPVHRIGVRTNALMQPLDGNGSVALENVRVAGRLLAGYNPVAEGSAEGVWLATASRAAAG